MHRPRWFASVTLTVVAVALALALTSTADAQYIPTLPTTTTGDVRSGGTDQAPGTGVGVEAGDGHGSIVATGSDLAWLARLGAGAVVVGGLVMMSPARRRGRADRPETPRR